MRIIAGRWKGHRLKSFKGDAIRPTPDRARETLFNIIGPSIKDASFLDLFAGTGAVGLEAMSRGAGEAVFVDSAILAAKVIRANLEICGIGLSGSSGDYPYCVFIKRDAVSAIRELARKKRRFDFVFLDPPYAEGLYFPVIAALRESHVLKPDGWLMAEHSSKNVLEFPEWGLMPFRVAKVGDTSFSLFEGKGLE